MSKNILGIYCVVLLGIFTATAAVYVKSDEMLQGEMREQHRLLCAAVTHALDTTVVRTYQLVSLVAPLPAITNVVAGRDREQARKLLNTLTEHNDQATPMPPLSLLDNRGNVLASSVFTSSQADSAFFQDAVQGRFAFQGPEISKETNEATLLVAAPVAQGKHIVGVLAAHMDLQQLSINVLPLLRDAHAENAFAFALDSTGRVVMHTNFGDLVGISMQDEPWAREMLRSKTGQISYDWLGMPRVAAFAPLPQPGWVVAVSLREEDVLAPQRLVRHWFVGGSLIVAALVLLSLYLLLRKSQLHLRAGSKLALAEFGSELRLLSGATPDDAELLHFGLSAALEKAQQRGRLLEHASAGHRERLFTVFTAMMEGILYADTDGAILFANPAALNVLRLQTQDVIGRQAHAVLLPPLADSNELSDVYQAMSSEHASTFTGKILRCRDGSLLLADIAVQPLRENGKAYGTVLAVSDVGLVDALQHMLSAIACAAGATYLVWDEQCRLVDCGDNCMTFFLAPGKDVFLKDFVRYMPELQANGRASVSELERRQLQALTAGSANCDWLFQNAMGETIPCDLVLCRLNIRGQAAVLGFARNMRPALEAEAKLASGHANLQQVLDALPVAVGIVGRGTLLYANRELEEFFAWHGNEPALAPFSPLQNASGASDRDFPQKIDARHLQFFKPDGSMHDYIFSCFPTEYNNTTALMGWLVDVTELKNEELRLIQSRDKALETIEANRLFLNQLERDVREPLNGIMFALQHAVQTRIDEGQQQAINAAYTFGRHLQDTLSYMLNMSAVTPQPLVHEATLFKVTDFFREVLQDFADKAESKGITFDYLFDPELPEGLVGDRTLLRLIMNQLIDNAVKYTVVGGVTVNVTRLPARKANTISLYITIADTGLGISDAQLGTLFRSFSDGAQNPKLLSENTSFELAMVRSYVRLLEGELCAVSEPGQGTEMHLVLPCALSEEKLSSDDTADETLSFLHVPLDAAPPRSQSAAKTKGRILVVDDIPTNMQIMVLILQKMGYEALGADSGARALELLGNEVFDLVFMDIQMPHMSGVETTVLIRNDTSGRYPRDIPIVAMTAHAMLGDPEKYMAAGMNDYLSKPVIIEDIANILSHHLQR
ncbi:MAG: response regulator [Deltaproteobacteria bacterium]|jgi:PAS domain S-box-containing protein|nr:response regulator [Deltaproteobacteria bacterium]